MWVARILWGRCGVSVGWLWVVRDIGVYLVRCGREAGVAWVLGGCGLVGVGVKDWIVKCA